MIPLWLSLSGMKTEYTSWEFVGKNIHLVQISKCCVNQVPFHPSGRAQKLWLTDVSNGNMTWVSVHTSMSYITKIQPVEQVKVLKLFGRFNRTEMWSFLMQILTSYCDRHWPLTCCLVEWCHRTNVVIWSWHDLIQHRYRLTFELIWNWHNFIWSQVTHLQVIYCCKKFAAFNVTSWGNKLTFLDDLINPSQQVLFVIGLLGRENEFTRINFIMVIVLTRF